MRKLQDRRETPAVNEISMNRIKSSWQTELSEFACREDFKNVKIRL